MANICIAHCYPRVPKNIQSKAVSFCAMQIGEIFDPSSSTPLKKTGQVTPKIVMIFDQFWPFKSPIFVRNWIFDENLNNLNFRAKNHMFEIFIFCPKIQLWFPEKIVDFFGVKNSRKCCGFGLFSYWQLWFHEKNCQKIFGWKTRENVGVLSKLNLWTKIRILK